MKKKESGACLGPLITCIGLEELSNYKGWPILLKNKKYSIIQEAVTNQLLWIWHVFFAKSKNDIKLLDMFPFVNTML
jgi:hypothetical protein